MIRLCHVNRTNRGQSDRQVGLPFFFKWMSCRVPLVLLVLGGLCAGPLWSAPSEELRGVWIVRHVLTSPDSIQRAVQNARNAGFNALFVQVRGRGDAYYRSRLVPPAENLRNEAGEFDPLALVVRLAHRAGLEVHAWVNVYLAWLPTERPPQSADHVFLRHPEWFMRSSDGIDMGELNLKGADLVSRSVEGRYLSPGVPEVRNHLLQVVREIVTGYDVDGIHLDYVRYPGGHYDFNLIARAEFARRYRFDPIELADRKAKGFSEYRQRLWERWRTDQISLLVNGLRRMILRTKPWVKLSAAVKPDFHRAYHQFGQDWVRWINKQVVDFVVPMFYVRPLTTFTTQVREVRKYVRKGHLYAGVGVYKHESLSESVQQVRRARFLGLRGIVLFSYDSVMERPELFRYLREDAFRQPARIPRMRWKQNRYEDKAQTRQPR